MNKNDNFETLLKMLSRLENFGEVPINLGNSLLLYLSGQGLTTGTMKSALGYLPIGLDGSCNGIQHYSAILRDKVGGAAVNLIDSDVPSDIYTDVSTTLYSKLDGISQQPTTEGQYARIWIAAAFDRKLTKRPVMTLPYGSTRQSCKEYIFEWMLDHRSKFPADDWELFTLALWLTPLLWDSIGEVVIAARAAMTWLQKTSSIALKKSRDPLTWVSPAGFPVYQAYALTKGVRIETMIAGTTVGRVRTTSQVQTCDVSVRKQRLGVAPNFIHSIDSSHMVKTINDIDLKAYAMIHDDFGTHAGNTEDLWTQIRITFVDMYKKYEPLREWYDYQIAKGIELDEELPPMGDLDIEDVRNSSFFFG